MTRYPSIRHLIKNYTLSPSHSLLELIINKTPLLISTDGSKTTTKCGGSWVIATTTKEIIASGPIPIYGQQKDIHSYRTEVYASLAVLLFLRYYAEYYSVTVQNKVVAICDNKGYVNKLNYLLDNPKSIASIHKMNESEALILILQNVPNDFSITNIAAHRDDNTNYGDLSMNAQLNVDADYLATKNITLPLNQHLESQPFALYMNGKYIHANISKDIRARSHEKEARLFLRNKYKWNERVFQSIEKAVEIYATRSQRISTSKLNNVLLPDIKRTPPPVHRGKNISIKYITQLPGNAPLFAFFTNYPQHVHESYKRFLENKIRDHFGFEGVPIRIIFKEK